jgi:hypothetical protein
MKAKILYICMLIGIVFIDSNAQSVILNNKTWSVVNTRMPSFTAVTEHLMIEGDTLIGSRTYKRMMKSTNKEQSNWDFYLFIRETDNGYLYFRPDTAQNDYLFYRPDAAIGDTLFLSSIQSMNGNKYIRTYPFRVESRDSIQISGLYRKRTTLRYTKMSEGIVTYFIEGIGSVSGLMYWNTGMTGGDGYFLICCSENDVLVFHNSQYPTCYYEWDWNGKNEISNGLVRVNTTTAKTLNIGLPTGTRGLFSIYDIKGKQYSRVVLMKNNTIITLPLVGIYLYRFESSDGKVQTGKVLVR